jgi:hypothetical protein
VAATLFLGAVPLSAQQANPAAAAPPSFPLFQSHETLPLRIEAPLTSIFKERGEERTDHPSKLVLEQPGAEPVALDIAIRTRGQTRLSRRICEFPPLRLEFDSAQADATVFRGQDQLKLVTHCQDGRPEHEQYVLQEYLVYRVLNLLSEISFRARLVRITYVDTDAKRDTVTRYAFLLEDARELAARTGFDRLEVPAVPPDMTDPLYLALVEVFQYMIGNPDWSAFMKEPDDEECCHNTVTIGDAMGPVFSVPYDFDITGLVNTRYADRLFRPAERPELGIRSVRERLYRGRCASVPLLPQVFALLNEKRDAIYQLYREQPDLDPKVLQESTKYLDEFFGIINDRRKAAREIQQKCREI